MAAMNCRLSDARLGKTSQKVASKMRVISPEKRNLVFELCVGPGFLPQAVAQDLIRGSPGSK